VTAVQVTRVNQLSDWQKEYQEFSDEQIAFARTPQDEARIE
jgi:formate dehydrogenase major subunit